MSVEPVDIEPVKAFLNGALQAHCMGNSMQYNIILQQFKVKDDPDTLWKVVLALNSFASLITQRSDTFRDLLSAIFTFEWTADTRLTKAILQLVITLVSCNAIFLSSACTLFAQSFLPKNITTATTSESITVDSIRKECTSLIHVALQSLLQQAPTGQSILLTTLYQHFPHKRFSKQVLAEYTSQLLMICEYLPTLQYRILDLIFERCLEMDVEIVIEESGDVRIQRDMDNVFGDTDPDGDGEDVVDVYNELFAQGASSSMLMMDCDSALKQRIPREVFDMAEKLDALLMLIVSFLQSQLNRCPIPTTLSFLSVDGLSTSTNKGSRKHSRSSQPQPFTQNSSSTPSSSSSTAANPLERLFEHLLKIFESRLIVAHKSKFVQFTMFYLTTRVPLFGEFFAKRLLALAMDKRLSSIMRQAAIMYLASFVSRSSFLSLSLVSDLLSKMIQTSAAYVVQLGGEQRRVSEELLQELQTHYGLDLSSAQGRHLNSHQQQLLAAFAANNNHHSASGTTSSSAATVMDRVVFVNDVEYDEYGRLRIKEHSARQHEVLYAFVQSACYILCFYGVEMGVESCCHENLVKECWDILFTSRFDPLRYMLKSVRNEFLKLALHIQLFAEESWDCFASDLLLVDTEFSPLPVMIYSPRSSPSSINQEQQQQQQQSLFRERKGSDSAGTVNTGLTSTGTAYSHHTTTTTTTKSIATTATTYTAPSIRSTHTNMTSHSQQSTLSLLGPNTLESFFPFDPCLLQRLHQCIEDQYRSWKGVPGLQEELLLRVGNGGGVLSRDMLIPSGGEDDDELGSGLQDSPVSSLAMSLASSLANNDQLLSRRLASSAMTAGRHARDRANSLNSMREVVAAAQRERRKAMRKEQRRADDPFGDGFAEDDDLDDNAAGLTATRQLPKVQSDEEEDDEDDDDDGESDIEDDLEESAFAQGLEIAQPVVGESVNGSGAHSHGSYFAQFTAMQQQQPQLVGHKSLTAESLRALSQGLVNSSAVHHLSLQSQHHSQQQQQQQQHERRSRLYSIGSTGSW